MKDFAGKKKPTPVVKPAAKTTAKKPAPKSTQAQTPKTKKPAPVRTGRTVIPLPSGENAIATYPPDLPRLSTPSITSDSTPGEHPKEIQDWTDRVKSGKALLDFGLKVADEFVSGDNAGYAGAKKVLSIGGIGLDWFANQGAGQGFGEGGASALGSFGVGEVLNEFSPSWNAASYADTAVNAANGLVKLVAGPRDEKTKEPDVTDVSQTVADMTPSQMAQSVAGNTARLGYNTIKGDDKAIARQSEDIRAGKSGAVMQGLAMTKDLVTEVSKGTDAEAAVSKIAEKGQDTALGRMGNWLGDQTFQFLTKDMPEAVELAKRNADGDSLFGDALRALF